MTEEDDETRTLLYAERLIAHSELPPGTMAGEYILEEFIAKGGCGAVFSARHIHTGKRAAVKVLNEAVAHSTRVLDRFAREIEALRSISHPSIVEIYEVGELDDHQPFYAMEHLEGQTLDALIKAEKRLGLRDVLELMEPVCAALGAAHAAGIIHRDVKASNIFICSGQPRTVKLLDFGIAKMMAPEQTSTWFTTAGRMPGTPSIMAPEQILGGAIDARVDIYALGVLLHRMLVGRLPFHTTNTDEMVRKHLEETPLPPSVRVPLPPELDAVVLRCMEKQRERRYGSVEELIRALREAIGGPSSVSPGGPDPTHPAVAVYLEVRTRGGADELDEALTLDIGQVLDTAEAQLSRAGFVLASLTSNEVLGVRLLPGDATEELRERRAALGTAAALHEALAQRPDADPRVHVNVCVHADEVQARPGPQPEITGGALMNAGRWAPTGEVHGVSATPSATAGMTSNDPAEPTPVR
ncbi:MULTISPECIES: serine/threonine-protein kinase [Sorangium]|uniref:Protein kinase n=1 Tax=Sorangium cellulosum TaxID=56 RepID=A0A4P2QE52_SORCE|nr:MULTISPECIES: serine/threonine-protein kinase [Sorangium]AUX28094.1 protein kinase [Sorangium cellulosum]WCQ87498.1 serine-threonine kinase [Sorangium sp. Soce836]